jgi:hypothetical protein
MPTKSPAPEAVVGALGQILRNGLPLNPASVAQDLLDLRGVAARATDPTDASSRTAALENTLRALLARYPDPRYAGAARALFGLTPTGGTLTSRRDRAAHLADHEVHHVRSRVEPRILEELAWQLVSDSDLFLRLPLVAPRLTPGGQRDIIPADPFAWEVAEQEAYLAQVWSALYAARAAALNVERLLSIGVPDIDLKQAAVTAAWRWAAARAEIVGYTSAFSPDLPVEDMIGLAGPAPDLTATQASRLTEAAVGAATHDAFVQALGDEIALGSIWLEGLRPGQYEKGIPA